MKRYYYYCLLIAIVVQFVSCNDNTKNNRLPEIPVDILGNNSLPLSEIMDEVIAIELELTDECLINPEHIRRIVLCDNYVIIAERDRIHMFGMDGKFVRPIGSKGRGPGEYMSIRNVAIDESNKHLFVYSTISRKIICYDLNGKMLKESSNVQQIGIVDINFINGELFLIAEQTREDIKGTFLRSAIYRLNDDFQITDSCILRDKYGSSFYSINGYEDYLLYGNSIVYSYYYELVPPPNFMPSQTKTVLRDTLYRLEENQLFPELKLKFENSKIFGSSGDLLIQLFNIYRSSRYIFAVYNNIPEKKQYHFCYDTKTGKGYNMQDGYTDDIHQIERRVIIRPLNSNTEFFYYWHTHIQPNDLEEPNPTLYIGKLKQI